MGSLFAAVEDLDADAYLNNCVELAVLNKPTTKNTAFVFIKPHAITDKVKEPAMAGPQKAEVIDNEKPIDQRYCAITS